MTIVSSQSPASLWSVTARPGPPTSPLDGDRTVDVAVIGGGYAGLSTALHVVQAGKSVVVLEAVDIGYGGAGTNNGQVIPALTRANPEDLRQRFGEERGNRLARLIAGSAAFTFDLIRKHGIECDAQQTGWVQPAHSPGRAVLARRRYEQWAELGADVAYLDREQVGTLTGAVIYHGGLLARTGGHVNPLGLARGLAEASLRAGAEIFTKSPVLSVAPQGDGWRLQTPNGAVVAGKVVVATDAYADALFPALRRSIVPVRSYQMATQALAPEILSQVLPLNHALSDSHRDLYFFHATADHRIVTGGALALNFQWRSRLDRRIGERLRRVFPVLGDDIRFEYQWYGDVAITTNFLPHFHQVAPGIITVIGYNGRGLALAAAAGRVLAQAALGHDVNDLDLPLTPLATIPLQGLVRRFSRIELLRYRWLDRQEVRA
ncbi:NAD(P)/FAD-dependent oxidoreductase [Telmatospirillum siberiense]|uniref:FAD dependent oxidoreductase domain-containing protein n=1 Tax=Telmatospirillum siberiense TaxID=382514 RepID=A0A2N3PNZ9_9PROT|nr:FAD-dependent oxidoreductase [Telmatospirillum siberiense]PKU22104.1 hypothetical protein CWS72_23620 [Telmatospirillum siberiense]